MLLTLCNGRGNPDSKTDCQQYTLNESLHPDLPNYTFQFLCPSLPCLYFPPACPGRVKKVNTASWIWHGLGKSQECLLFSRFLLGRQLFPSAHSSLNPSGSNSGSCPSRGHIYRAQKQAFRAPACRPQRILSVSPSPEQVSRYSSPPIPSLLSSDRTLLSPWLCAVGKVQERDSILWNISALMRQRYIYTEAINPAHMHERGKLLQTEGAGRSPLGGWCSMGTLSGNHLNLPFKMSGFQKKCPLSFLLHSMSYF